MIHLTQPDLHWLIKLVAIVDYIYQEYPELFSKEDEEILAITKELIRSLQ